MLQTKTPPRKGGVFAFGRVPGPIRDRFAFAVVPGKPTDVIRVLLPGQCRHQRAFRSPSIRRHNPVMRLNGQTQWIVVHNFLR